MRYSNGILIYFLLFLFIAAVFDNRFAMLYLMENQKIRYDSILAGASEDASFVLISKDRGDKAVLDKEQALQVFFQSLYEGFGIMDDGEAQEKLQRYIPLIMVADLDGIYFWYHGLYESNQKEQCRWSEKYPYTCMLTGEEGSKKYYINFALNDNLYIMDTVDYEKKEGTYKDMSEAYPDCPLFQDRQYFEEKKAKVISDTIMEKIERYINHYNELVRKQDDFYHFFVPYQDLEQSGRNFRQISFLALFEGYPLGNGLTETYQRMSFCAARLKKKAAPYEMAERRRLCAI